VDGNLSNNLTEDPEGLLSLDDLMLLDRLCWVARWGSDITECLDSVLQKAVELTKSRCGAMFLTDPVFGDLKIATSPGLPPIQTGQIEYVRHAVSTSDGTISRPLVPDEDSEMLDPLRGAGCRSGLLVQIKANGQSRGLLTLGSTRLGYSNGQITVAESIARYSALAIGRALACRDAVEKAGVLQSVLDITASLVSERGMDETLSLVAERASQLVTAELTAVGLLEDGGAGLRFLHAKGKLADRLEGRRVDAARWPMRSVLESRVAEAFNDLSNDTEADQDTVRELDLRTMLIAPLKIRDSVMGVLGAANRQDGRPFSTGDLRLLETLANHAAVAISNARLYSAARETLLKLDAERTKLEGILSNLADGVVVCDSEWRVLIMNRAAEEITGMHADSIIGRDIISLHPPEYRKQLEDILRPASGPVEGDTGLHEMRMRMGPKILRVNASAVTAGDEHVGVAMVLQDITASEELAEAKAEFVSTVSHELKTPLTALKGSIGLLIGQAAGELDPKVRGLLAIAENNCNRLVHLIQDMTDFADIKAEQMSLRVAPTSIYECAVNAVTGLQQIAAEKDVSLVVRLVGAPPLTMADQDRIEQVVTNLLSNAIKFSPQNSEVIVSVRHIHRFVRVSVQDFGQGIPRQECKKVFDKFYQVGGPSSREKGGSGLGLAISKAIVEQHGGKIYVRSLPGHGSTFVFTIPIPGGVGQAGEK
jgi:PAS domain S-box-containing protein